MSDSVGAKRLTPTERAEKILELCWQRTEERKPQSALKIIAVQISEAEREAGKHPHKGCLPCSKQHEVSYAEGFRAAREKAKEALFATQYNAPEEDLTFDELRWNRQMEEIAQRIGEMEP